MLKQILCSIMVGTAILGSTAPVLAAETAPIPGVISPRYTDLNTRSIDLSYSSGKINCSLRLTAYKTSTEISGTLTLTGSDGSEYSWDIDGIGSVRISKSVTATADEYTLTFSGYCGSDDLYLEKSATR